MVLAAFIRGGIIRSTGRGRLIPPVAGERILRAAKDAGYTAIGNDIVDRLKRRELGLQGVTFTKRDFLTAPIVKDIVSVACNSPFEGDLLRRFCERAVETASLRAAVLCRLARLVAAQDWLDRRAGEAGHDRRRA